MPVSAAGLGPTLMVAGEPSGDALLRRAFSALPHDRAHLYYGPPGALPAGLARVGTAPSAGMGLAAGPRRVTRAALDLRRLVTLASERHVSRALLFNWTEASAWLGRALRARGIPVLQIVAPQVFAWRRGRLETFGASCDALAVLFSFEEPLWRQAGVRATFVGHPLAEEPATSLCSSARRRDVALLPGSRASEVERLLPAFLEAGRLLRRDGLRPRVILSPRLPPRTQVHARMACLRADIPVRELELDQRLGETLAGHAVALAASGTATLECALADVPPVIAYRADRLTAALFRRLTETPWIGLPNVLLRREVYPELLQEDVAPERLRAAALSLWATPPRVREELRPLVMPPAGRPFAEHVAALADQLPPR